MRREAGMKTLKEALIEALIAQDKLIVGESRSEAFMASLESNGYCIVPMEATEGMFEALLDDQTPFICRRKMDKSGYEIVEQKNPEWRDVVADPMDVVAEFYDSEEAWAEHARLEIKWKLRNMLAARPKLGD
jgi:hypothetical protein